MAAVEYDMSDLREFVDTIQSAAKGDFRKDFETYLEALGVEFLRLVQDEFVKRHKNTGSGQLVSSFQQGGAGNVWKYDDAAFTLEVGTSLTYASYVNDGHRTSKDGRDRFVPGYWQGQRFIYDPNADGGMYLKFHWVEGLHFWEAAMIAMEKIIPATLDVKLQEWLDNYFGM